MNSQTKEYMITIIMVTISIVLLSMIVKYNFFSDKKEGMFKTSGQKNKRECQNFHLARFWSCVNNAGGTDPNGNCWAQVEPSLVACNKGYF